MRARTDFDHAGVIEQQIGQFEVAADGPVQRAAWRCRGAGRSEGAPVDDITSMHESDALQELQHDALDLGDGERVLHRVDERGEIMLAVFHDHVDAIEVVADNNVVQRDDIFVVKLSQ